MIIVRYVCQTFANVHSQHCNQLQKMRSSVTWQSFAFIKDGVVHVYRRDLIHKTA